MKIKFLLPLLFTLCLNNYLFAQTTTYITGTVKDSLNNEPLISANVYLEGTSIGTSTDYRGRFRINRVPSGNHILITSYVGYQVKKMQITVTSQPITNLNLQLSMDSYMIDEVVVTAQIAGQVRAINKQINSKTIMNVVSADKIKELPDNNAAESIGRLPGISIQREAGEGTKVNVRGLSPRFNSITVNGEKIPSTDAEDRSVDLSMISSEVLAGIEVYKSLTPDMDADAVGGTINFVIKEASEGSKYSFRQQSGYNDHESDFGQYKGSTSFSNRFFNNKFGAIVTANWQKANRSSDQLNVGYIFVKEIDGQAEVGVNNLNLNDVVETRKRMGSSVSLDYDLENGNILYNMLWAKTNRDEVRRRRRYRIGAFYQEYVYRDREIDTSLLTNSLSGTHDIDNFKIEWRVSNSKTRRDTPFSHTATFRELGAFNSDLEENKGPLLIPISAQNEIDETFFKSAYLDKEEISDDDITAKLDLKYDFKFGDNISGYFKFGGKIRNKDRKRSIARDQTSAFGIDGIGRDNPSLFDLDREGRILISNFLGDFKPDPYLNGEYKFGVGLDGKLIEKFRTDFSDNYYMDPVILKENYTANEKVSAGYLMSQLNIGNKFTIIPGFRIEETKNKYTGKMGDPVQVAEGQYDLVNVVDTTGSRTYSEFLPMLQAKYDVTNWFDIRLAATKTLSRPNYFNLVPWERITRFSSTIERGNPNLKHTSVWNYDAFFSFYNNAGLFTVGGFYKKLKNIDYIQRSRDLTPGPTFGFDLTEPVNGNADTEVKGVEVEIQTNLRNMPSPFDGFVLYFNYTRIYSKTYFPLFQIGSRDPNPPYKPTVIIGEREGRLPGQSDNIANVTIGYEKGGFSGRYSITYQGESLQFVGTRSELDGFSGTYSRHDIVFQQKFSENYRVFLNINNITNYPEEAFLGSQLYPTNKELFGLTADFGVQIKF